MIRPEFRNLITHHIEASGRFKAADFTIRDEASKTGSILTIEYRFADSYAFKAEIPHNKSNTSNDPHYRSKDYIISIWMSPGGITTEEREKVEGRDSLLGSIKRWTDLIHEDLRAAPVNRKLAAQQAELEKLLHNLEGLPDEYFTQEEAQALKAKLTDLEEQLKKNLHEHIQDKETLRTSLNSLTSDFVELKSQIDSLKRSKWGGALMVRALDWLRIPANQKLLKSGAEVVQNMLTDGKSDPT